MSNRADRAAQIAPLMRRDRQKAASFGETVPSLLQAGMVAAANDYAKGRQVAAAAAQAAPLLEAKPYAVGLVTNPGDPVQGDGYVYLYSGKDTMTHNNPLFYPGSVGVYYWAIVPNIKDGVKIFPGNSGIIVAVEKDEIWYNPAGTKKYRWNADNWTDCPSNYYPGAAGVHQWVDA